MGSTRNNWFKLDKVRFNQGIESATNKEISEKKKVISHFKSQHDGHKQEKVRKVHSQ